MKNISLLAVSRESIRKEKGHSKYGGKVINDVSTYNIANLIYISKSFQLITDMIYALKNLLSSECAFTSTTNKILPSQHAK